VKLFYAPQSPFARKVRAAAIELGLHSRIELEYAEVLPGKPNSEFARERNALRKVPTLITDEGATIFDSTVICEYLDSLTGGGVLVPRDGPERWRVLTMHAVAQGMCESAILIRYETWLRPEPARWPIWIEDQWNRIDSGLDWFERNPPTPASIPTMAHLALGSALGYIDFRWPSRAWRDRFPHVSRWFMELETRASFESTKPSTPPTVLRPGTG